MTDMLIKTLESRYGENFIGMSTGGNELEISFIDKKVTIVDYANKTIMEILEEIDK